MSQEKLHIRQRRWKERMSGKNMAHIFIIGVVYDIYNKKSIEAVKLYDIHTKESYIQSVGIVKQRIEKGEEIVGAHIKYNLKQSKKSGEYTVVSTLVFENGAYNCRKTDILNGKGEVILPGNRVIIGIRSVDDKEDQLITINGNCEVSYISENDAINKGLNGVFQKRYICLNSRQKVI